MPYDLTLRQSAIQPFLVRDRPRSGYSSFSDALREFISSRLDRINPYAESEEYCSQQEIASHLHNCLHDLLPESARPALREYADALGTAHCIEAEIFAERAFLDEVRIIIRAMGDGRWGMAKGKKRRRK